MFLSTCAHELLLEHETEQEKIWKKYARVDVFPDPIVMDATNLPTAFSVYTFFKKKVLLGS